MAKHFRQWVVVVLVTIGVVCYGWGVQEEEQASGPRLPGARIVIDASRFTSLQAAIDALPAEGGAVLIPPGEFRIERPLLITQSDVLIQGSGTATHIVNTNRQGEPALRIGRTAEQQPASERPWRVMVSNLRVTGNPESGHGIEALAVNELFIQEVTVSYHGGDGIRLDQCYEDPRVSDCLITYNKGTGLNLLGCHDIVVSANQFEENNDGLRCTDGFNLCMTGNCLDDHLGNGVIIENTYGSVVSGNMIEECRRAAIVLDRDCYGITLSANVIAHNGEGIDLKDAHGCAVSANTFTINDKYALRISENSGRITVSANNFCNSYIGEGKVKRGSSDLAAAGVLLHATRQIVFSGNLFSSLRPKAVDVSGSDASRILFHGNLIVDSPTDHPQLKDSLIEDNLVVPHD
ncbi:MAG: hypothetical protein KatS3mg110_0840 [Pirellulaceae bacterium]|nr:MAG: hypothetical protein KatS3mg110_0840 [Pirellulaceae bacterium]